MKSDLSVTHRRWITLIMSQLNLGDRNSRRELFQSEVAYVSPPIFQKRYQFDKYNTVIKNFPISNFCSWLDEWTNGQIKHYHYGHRSPL